MPQILRYPWDNLKVTLSSTGNNVTAIVFRRGAKRATLQAVTTAARLSFDETDQAAMSVHDSALYADTTAEIVLPANAMTGLARKAAVVTIATNPADAERYYLTVAGTQVIFEFDDGGGAAAGTTAVTIGVNAAATATNLAAAISASALSCEAERGLRSTSEVHILTSSDATMSHRTNASTKLTLGDIDPHVNVLYLASATASQVVKVMSEGE